MGKRKEDRGEETGNKPKRKKKKAESASNNQSHTTAEAPAYVDLGAKKRVTVSDFKGKRLIDIREYYDKDGEELPGKKGISLTVDQWNVLKSSITEIETMLEQELKSGN